MEYDKDKFGEMALALLQLASFNNAYGTRAWKGMAWEVLDRLYEKGYINDPKGKAKLVAMSESGEKLSEALFFKKLWFGKIKSAYITILTHPLWTKSDVRV